MANRTFNRRQALEKEIKDLYANISIGGTGAPTLNKVAGIKSVTRNSAGDYTIVLEDRYVALKFFKAIHIKSSAENLTFQVKAHNVASASAPSIEFLCLTAGTPTDPASGDVLLIKIEVKNTSAV